MQFETKIALAIVCLASLLSGTSAQCSLRTATPKFRRAIFDFTTGLVKRVAHEEENHFVVSPLSIWTLLAMTSEGAEGKTYEELRRTLRLHKQPCFKDKYYQLVQDLSVHGDEVTFLRSGVVVIDKGLQVKQRFLKLVSKLGASEVKSLYFSDSDESARAVNEYVSEQTHGNIEEAVQPGEFKDAAMLLIDTVYFKAQWNSPFESSKTQIAAFYNEQGLEIGQVNLMEVVGNFPIAEIDNIGARVLEMPYGSDNRFSMLVFLPYHNEQLTNVIENLEKSTLSAIFKKFEHTGPLLVELFLPRFKITSELDTLRDLLIDLGVKRLFDETQAELGGISDTRLAVSRLLQKAEIEVTEEGTEASAFSEGAFSSRTLPEIFKVEKPFLYLVVDKFTQSVIFGGAYSKPSLY